ncbi:hypothetical protein LJR034_008608 [Caballeronia sp. LjRoot34]|uniref:hypothetical protein n=1 Tax=Caballeronia sp. LjRoot34 TaxID=3342325 RepID=UPI003ED149C7
MKETLDMKVTISAVATPELYRTMIGVSNPRQRAALLKRLADDYLKGVVSPGHAQVGVLEPLPPGIRHPPPEVAIASLPATQTHAVSREAAPTTKSSPAPVTVEDDEHYDFLENNLTGFG